MKRYKSHEEWKALERKGSNAIRQAILGEIKRLSKDGLGPSQNIYDAQKKPYLPSASVCQRLLKIDGWAALVKAAGQKPRKYGPEPGSRDDGGFSEHVIKSLQQLGSPTRRLVVKHSSKSEPYSYFCTTRYRTVHTRKYSGGHFELSSL